MKLLPFRSFIQATTIANPILISNLVQKSYLMCEEVHKNLLWKYNDFVFCFLIEKILTQCSTLSLLQGLEEIMVGILTPNLLKKLIPRLKPTTYCFW